MNDLRIFMPCAVGVEHDLAAQAQRITGLAGQPTRAGVLLQASWRDAMLLNLHDRLAQRVLIQLAHAPYRQEQDLYELASQVAWEAWFTPRQTFKIDITAQHSPLKSLNFAALRVKDALVDRFRARSGVRPSVQTQWPDVRIFVHLTAEQASLYIDTSGEPLFKRGWRADKGDAPLKETLAAAMLAASGWDAQVPLYDPCCGSGTIAIEAAQIACNMAPGLQRRFGFEKLLPHQPHVWSDLRQQAQAAVCAPRAPVYGSDVSHRMVDFALRNAERAGVAHALQLRGGDALQRMPPDERPGLLLLNPPYGERIEAGGVAGSRSTLMRRAPRPMEAPAPQRAMREAAHTDDGGDFFSQLASHWKKNYSGWTAWVLTPDLQLPARMRFKESRRHPMWNGPIECRLFRFDLMAGRMARPGRPAAEATPDAATPVPITLTAPAAPAPDTALDRPAPAASDTRA